MLIMPTAYTRDIQQTSVAYKTPAKLGSILYDYLPGNFHTHGVTGQLFFRRILAPGT